MPRETELLELREEYTQGGIWGIGLSIEKVPPHKILHVEDLIDRDGANCSNLVSVGDSLLKVDDVSVQDVSIESLEAVIFGPVDTVIKLSMLGQANRSYDIHVKRHVPINVWDRTLRWYSLKTEYEGQDFMAQNKIISVSNLINSRLLVLIRLLTCAHAGPRRHAPICARWNRKPRGSSQG